MVKLIGESFVSYNLDRNQHSHYILRKPGFHLNIGRARDWQVCFMSGCDWLREKWPWPPLWDISLALIQNWIKLFDYFFCRPAAIFLLTIICRNRLSDSVTVTALCKNPVQYHTWSAIGSLCFDEHRRNVSSTKSLHQMWKSPFTQN